MQQYVLALDQGTTSSRAILFDRRGRIVASSQQELPQILPRPGEVEHDPEAIWESQTSVARRTLEQARVGPAQVAAIGITNQRETTVLWERASGRPIHHAIVWQSRVSAGICQQLRSGGHETIIREKTGLLLDPYFSGTKIRYLLDKYPSLRGRAERGEVLFGTVDSFLIWRLTGGRHHVTDVSNASRTMLFNLHTLDWDDELLQILGVPRAMLPEVRPSSQVYGHCEASLFGGEIPLSGDAGDQQAATFGQACFDPGTAKNTYGTGCFLLLNTGHRPVPSQNSLLTTVGWQIDGQVTYCLEGSVFIAGAVVQWLRDGLGLIENSQGIEALCATVPDSGGVVFVPAFVGLGAPHWDPYARGAVFGITRGTTAGHLARAAVESMALQTSDLLDAMRNDARVPLTVLNVDGGASVNVDLMQFQADILNVTVRRPVVAETTALGAAYLAGLAVGYWDSQADVVSNWSLDREFTPHMEPAERAARTRRWRRAVERARDWEERPT
ncbi:MAG: glycerol kinase GlpK [Pirellulaceae bacterium]